jgi:O-antigen/teichoic acid export membrane protein
MLREAAVLGVVTLLGLIHFKVDTLLLSVLQSAVDVGIYGVAYKVHDVLFTFPGVFVGILFPLFSRFAREDQARLQQVFQRAFEVLVITGVGAALAVFVLAPDLGPLLGAAQAVRPMRILAMALPSVFVALGFTHLLLAEARQRWMVPLYALLVIVNFSLNIFAIRQWSYVGAAAVTVVSESLSLFCLSVYWLGRRRWKLRLRVLIALPLAIAIGFLLASLIEPASQASNFMHIVRLAAMGVLTLGAYAAGVLLLRLIPISALRALLPRGNAGSEASPPLA